jgi:hypothetical protein
MHLHMVSAKGNESLFIESLAPVILTIVGVVTN